MRYAIIADIHANLAAFTAVLEDIQRRGEVAEVWCLGDVVGYGPDPHQRHAIFDSEGSLARLYRVQYDIGITQARMMEQNLPVRQANRLSNGM